MKKRASDSIAPTQGSRTSGLSTRELDRTRDFYEHVMGFTVVRCDIIKMAKGGRIRHIFFGAGRDQLLAFMEPPGVPGIPAD